MDLSTYALRSDIEKDVVDLLVRASHRASIDEVFCDSDIFALRQFIGWHRLRFGSGIDLLNVAERLSLYIEDCGRAVQRQDDLSLCQLDKKMVTARLKRGQGSLSVCTLSRRVVSISRILAGAGCHQVRDEPAVIAALRAVRLAAGRQRADARANRLDKGIRERMLATCEQSLAGARDLALLTSWFACGKPVLHYLRIDLQPLLDDIGKCDEQVLRHQAFNAVNQWSELTGLQEAPLFRHVRPHGRLGAPMTRVTAQQMLNRRLELAEGRIT